MWGLPRTCAQRREGPNGTAKKVRLPLTRKPVDQMKAMTALHERDTDAAEPSLRCAEVRQPAFYSSPSLRKSVSAPHLTGMEAGGMEVYVSPLKPIRPPSSTSSEFSWGKKIGREELAGCASFLVCTGEITLRRSLQVAKVSFIAAFGQ